MASNCGDIVHYARQELISEDKRYAAAHLNETDATRENALAEIRRWIEEIDDLPAQIDDFLILRFLRVCKFDIEKTKDRIRNYYKQRSDLPEWYRNKDPLRPELQELLEMGIVLPLRKPDSQGRIVFLVRGTLHDPRIHKMSDLAKIGILITEAAIKYYPAASIYGCAVYVDVINLTMRHVLQFSSPFVLRNLIHTFQKCYPIRYQKIVIFNALAIFDIVMRIIKSFMTEKIKNRFYVYSHQHCFEDIPANILPVEYGGTDGTLQELTGYWKKWIEENRDWFTEDENCPNSETCRDSI
ncbi:retinol-binding protein pinta [Solenopsis invicta]|uniref:retinol-binding protein pinta n=1 Tax=Solenopsis invicta TaxID=13686 RepID=UPI000595FE7C|nr:retinol-binding protein pinta [Solenopsis invicta]